METALFSPSSLFAEEDEQDDSETERGEDAGSSCQTYLERNHTFPGGVIITIREYSFHQLNANLLWPGTFAFAEWLLANPSYMQRKRILELGSGTGALSIFLKKTFQVDITTSDYDDVDIEENIAYNCRANNLDLLPHVRHSWGEPFPAVCPDWDLIIASDILLYVKQYPSLIKTICFLLKGYKPAILDEVNPDNGRIAAKIGMDVSLCNPEFVMSWRRRIGKEDETLFFKGCEDAGLAVKHLGARVYSICCAKDAANYHVEVKCSFLVGRGGELVGNGLLSTKVS